jgi:hypothetical protein
MSISFINDFCLFSWYMQCLCKLLDMRFTAKGDGCVHLNTN